MQYPKLTQKMLDVGNAPARAKANAELATEIRAFRPGPVAGLSDAQLVWAVDNSRQAALDFGLEYKRTIKQWIYVDLLLAPGFHGIPDLMSDVNGAYGDPDTKARDLFQTLKVLFRRNGRGAEIWW
ncbi:hypothetical protein [Actibacterium sp. 188UL27-1]|uniref:hypothetical protein n=1 Tax=Actibacterium sp. 188UL27-1 TaxID=2786961 RepID=UPI00195EBC41|nr:hypothetical protein [Actibacterium sp. 188UL27-1]MBM7066486.1 hypothetical protein [Actibacterium sp. 188UL27-1]